MQAKVFSAATSTPNDIMVAGEQAQVDLYSGNPWEELDGKLMPLLTDLSPAPDELLKMTRCNCHA